MKKIIAGLAILTGVLFTASVWAEHEGGKSCPVNGKSCSMSGESAVCAKCGEKEECYECPVVSKIMKKAHFFLDNKEELALSDDQVTAIKAIKLETKKAAIRQGANMQIGMMDMEAMLSEPTVNVEGLNTMIDQGMAAMAQEAKAGVANYAKLKAVLTEEQMAKAKELWKKK